jgi:PAS domain S-box-containing protein
MAPGRHARSIDSELPTDVDSVPQPVPTVIAGALRDLQLRALAATDRAFSISDPRQPDNPLVWVNPAFTSIMGYEPSEVLGRNCRFLQGPDTDTDAVLSLGLAIAERRTATTVLLNYRKDGTPFWNDLSVTPVYDDSGELMAFVAVQVDVTDRIQADRDLRAAHRAERAARADSENGREQQLLLAEATALLTATLDVDEAIGRLVRLVIPALGDWAVVSLLDEAGRGVVRAMLHRDGHKDLLQRYADLLADGLGEGTLQSQVLRTQQPVLITRFRPGYAGEPDVPYEVIETARALGLTSGIVVPLIARRRMLGTLSLISGPSGRVFTQHDLEIARDLGRRAALALDNARLYQQEHQVAETLQRSLLPDLPHISDVESAVQYLAGNTAASVGGDFYELLDLPDGAVGMAVGDVVGHDLQAAAQMGHLRGLLRACAWDPGTEQGRDPARVIARVDRLVQGLSAASMASLIYARAERIPEPDGGWTIDYASAGHPHPLLRLPDGQILLLDRADGLLMGVSLDTTRRSATLTVPCGSTLLMYTDGLIERRGEDLDISTAALCEVVRQLPLTAPPEQLCATVVGHAGQTLEDDVAVLAVRLN